MFFSSDEPHLRALVSAVERGEALDLGVPKSARPSGASGSSRPWDHAATKYITAGLIRRIILGLPLEIPHEPQPRVVKITSAGISIRAATIRGRLDLDDLSGGGGSALPGLAFDGCWFEQEISLKRCHLKSLSLRGCRFSAMQAEEAVIDGPVKLSDIRRPEEFLLRDKLMGETKTWGSYVVLRGARIGGHLNCARATFAAMPRSDTEEEFVENSKHPRYALDLRATQIRGSALLRPGVTALGGISFTLARIQGSIWCNGAKLTAWEGNAFSADYAEIQGSLYLRTYDPPQKEKKSSQFIAEGQVSLFATKLGGSLYLEGAELRKQKRKRSLAARSDDNASLDATNATIGGDCKVTCWQSDVDETRFLPFNADGEILLNSASIRNSVLFLGSNVESVSAKNINVGGRFDMSVYDDPLAFKAWNAEQLRMTAASVHLEGAVISGDLLMLGAMLGANGSPPGKEHGLFARGAKIGGNCHLTTFPHEQGEGQSAVPFICRGRVLVQEAIIGNSLVMAGAKLDCQLLGDFSVVDFSGTSIGGHAKFMTWQPDDFGKCIPFELRAGEAGLRLAGTKIAQKLILNGAQITSSKIAINAANIEVGGKASLGTYEGKSERPGEKPRVYQFTASGKVSFTTATIKLGLDMIGSRLKPPVTTGGNSTATGTSELVALDLTLARMKFLRLGETVDTTKSDVAPRTHVLFDAVGALVLDHAEVDTDINLRGARLKGRLVADHAKVGTSIDLTGIQLWGGSAQTTFEQMKAEQGADLLEKSVWGKLAELHADKMATADLSLYQARIGGGLMVDKLEVFQQFDLAAYASAPYLRRLNYATVDLGGLHVQELQDLGGKGWGEDVRFWLDGFRYNRLVRLPRVQISAERPPESRVRSRLFSTLLDSSRKTSAAHSGDDVWKPRLAWLNLQYFDAQRPQTAEFTPGAYEQLVKTLNADGAYNDAHRIISSKLTLESRLNPNPLHKIAWGGFHWFFNYGLSPVRAVLTFIFCILLGSAATYVADKGLPGQFRQWFPKVGHVLFISAAPPETKILEGGSRADWQVVPLRDQRGAFHSDPLPCGDKIHPVLYALDVFVPVLDLRQQSACSISSDKPGWKVAQAVYAVLGWFLTPLALLTFSGILKRHLEK